MGAFIDYLRGKTIPFDVNSKEYRQGTLFVFATLLCVVTLSYFLSLNLSLKLYVMAWVITVMLLLVVLNYIYFRITYHLLFSSYILMFAVTSVTIAGLYFPGSEPETILFWVAALPLFTFLLLGQKHGFYWSIVNAVGIATVLIVSIYLDSFPIFSKQQLIQTLFGFFIVTAVLYYFEYQRNLLSHNLQISVKEKSLLLKELHHRVKNNMQVMMSLLWLQADKINEPECEKLLHENIDRLSAMALIHEKLYISKSLDSIELLPYLDAIIDNSMKITKHRIVKDIAPLCVDIKIAMNLGLILNEALNNAIKYAFAPDSVGTISVQLMKNDHTVLFQIKDNGRGMKESEQKSGGVGLNIISDLSQALPEGRLEWHYDHGTTLKVYFESKASHDS